jgi:hypothetical protein
VREEANPSDARAFDRLVQTAEQTLQRTDKRYEGGPILLAHVELAGAPACERYARLLPTEAEVAGSSMLTDNELVGSFLSGGVRIPATDLRAIRRLTGWMTPDDTRAVLAGAGARSGVALATDQSLAAVDAHHDIARPILLAHIDRPSRLVKRAAVHIRRMRRLMPLGDRRATQYTKRVTSGPKTVIRITAIYIPAIAM